MNDSYKRTLLTSEGLMMLIKMKKKGEKLPEFWKEDVARYVTNKQKIMEKWMEEYNDACEEYNNALRMEKKLHGFKD